MDSQTDGRAQPNADVGSTWKGRVDLLSMSNVEIRLCRRIGDIRKDGNNVSTGSYLNVTISASCFGGDVSGANPP